MVLLGLESFKFTSHSSLQFYYICKKGNTGSQDLLHPRCQEKAYPPNPPLLYIVILASSIFSREWAWLKVKNRGKIVGRHHRSETLSPSSIKLCSIVTAAATEEEQHQGNNDKEVINQWVMGTAG